jgi:hypothetical protein
MSEIKADKISPCTDNGTIIIGELTIAEADE